MLREHLLIQQFTNKMATQKYMTTSTPSRPMWTTVTRRTPTSTSTACARSEHACTLLDVLFFITCHTHIGSSRHLPIFTPCTCAFLSELLDFSFYLSPHFLVFFLSFLSMYSDNFDSVTNNLLNSANGTFVTSDDTFPLTDHPESQKTVKLPQQTQRGQSPEGQTRPSVVKGPEWSEPKEARQTRRGQRPKGPGRTPKVRGCLPDSPRGESGR